MLLLESRVNKPGVSSSTAKQLPGEPNVPKAWTLEDCSPNRWDTLFSNYSPCFHKMGYIQKIVHNKINYLVVKSVFAKYRSIF